MTPAEAAAYRQGVAAAKAQAEARGCAKPLGFARWDFDGQAVHLRVTGKAKASKKAPETETEPAIKGD